MPEQLIQFAVNGTPGSGFLVMPEGAGPFPAVVVIQEWWGLNEQIKGTARRFAEQGYITLAPDLYHGRVVSEPNEAQKEAMNLDRPRAVQEIVGAVSFLKAHDAVTPKKIGIVGFCMGGGLTLAAANATQDLGAAVAFYGGGAPDVDAFAQNKAAILNLCGEKDDWVTNNIQALDASFTERGYSFPHSLVVYPGAQHAFFNERRPEVYDPAASTDAFARALGWFKEYLV